MPRRRTSRRKTKPVFSSSEDLFLLVIGLLIVFVSAKSLPKIPSISIDVSILQIAVIAVGIIVAMIGIFGLARITKKGIKFYKDMNRFQGYHSIDEVYAMDPVEFEKLVGHVLRNEGFTDVELTRFTNDGGIDLTARRAGKNTMVQVKRYKIGNNVGSPAVREFVGSFVHKAHEGWFVTSSDYTIEAKKYAAATPNLHLIDGKELDDMMGRLPANFQEIFLIQKS